MEKACHQLREENLKALFNHKYTYSAPGLCFHLNHAHRAPAPQLSCQKSLVFQLLVKSIKVEPMWLRECSLGQYLLLLDQPP